MAKTAKKNKMERRKFMTRILAGFLAGIMALGMATTLIWYLING